MRIIVIGGSGRTGLLIIEKLVKAGHAVVATIRNPRHMAETVKRADAVVFAAGSAAGEGSALDRIGTRRTVHAAENAGVKRYLSISALGASTGLSIRSMDDEMKDYYKQKRAAAKFMPVRSAL